MSGDEMRAMREARGETQMEFADFLNGLLQRRYDKGRVSRWEKGTERIPQPVADSLRPGNLRRRKSTATIVAFSNQKGGVAKTTTAVNVAYALAELGQRVLLIDADAQASATAHLGVDQVDATRMKSTLHDVLRGTREVSQAKLAVCDGKFDLLPSSIVLAAAEPELLSEPMNWMLLKEKLVPVRGIYHYILIDCPPNLSLMTQNALVAADKVVIPVQCEVLSMIGVPMLLESISKIRRRGNPDLEIFGILPTMYNAKLTQDRATLADLHDRFGSFLKIFEPVPRATLFSQSVAAGKVAVEVGDPAKVEALRHLARSLVAADMSDRQDAHHAA